MPGQFVPSPKNRTLRRGGSRVSPTGREESGPLSGPRQIAVRARYRIPPRTSSAPSPIRNILAPQFIAATHNEPGFKRQVVRFVPGTLRPFQPRLFGAGALSMACSASRCPSADLFLLDIVRPPLRKGRYAPPVHMIKPTETREITPY